MQEMTLIHSSDSGSVPNRIQASQYPYSRLEWRSVHRIKPERYLFLSCFPLSFLFQNEIICFKIKCFFVECLIMFLKERNEWKIYFKKKIFLKSIHNLCFWGFCSYRKLEFWLDFWLVQTNFLPSDDRWATTRSESQHVAVVWEWRDGDHHGEEVWVQGGGTRLAETPLWSLSVQQRHPWTQEVWPTRLECLVWIQWLGSLSKNLLLYTCNFLYQISTQQPNPPPKK